MHCSAPLWRWTAALAFVIQLAPALSAQQDEGVSGQDLVGPLKLPKFEAPGPRPVVPQPPPGVFGVESPHPDVPIPIGVGGNPQPDDPPCQDTDPSQLAPDSHIRYYYNNPVTPGSLTTSDRTPEPSSATNRDTALQTGNWYCGLSLDSGKTWSPQSPYSFFTAPTTSGGFCCDQKAVYVESHDITVWLLQYNQHGTTGNNVYRFAVARGRDVMRSMDASQWALYDFDAQDFGYAAGAWMDYPDIAFDGTWLHCSANVFGIAGSNSVRWRMDLADLQNGTPLSWTWSTSATLLGWNYRFAGGVHPSTGNMYWACFNTTTSMYVYHIPEASNTWNRASRAIASWSNTTASCLDPSNNDSCGRVVGRLRGGGGNGSEIVFMWTSNTTGASRPMPFTRVARFRTSDKTLLAEHDIWNSNYTFYYGSCWSNDVGDFGGVIGVGGGTLYPHTSVFVINASDPWPPAHTLSMVSGNASVSQNRFGDYFDVRRHETYERTWVASGSANKGGTGSSFAEPHYAWFGDVANDPGTVNLDVTSTPITAVPIGVDATDVNGNKDGNTNFTRTYMPRQGYELTAPATHISGRTRYFFRRWHWSSVPTGSLIAQTPGVLDLTISDIGGATDRAQSEYMLGFTSPRGLDVTEGNASFIHWGGSRRFQHIDNTQTGSFSIDCVAWRRNGGGGGGSAVARTFDLEVKMAHVNFGQLSEEFNRNFNLGPTTTVFSKKSINFPDWTADDGSPAHFDFFALLDAPYSYNRNFGALCIDFFYDNNTQTGSAQMDRDYTGATTATGSSIGTGCVATGRVSPFSHTMRLENNGSPLPNFGMRVRADVSNAPANAAIVMNLDLVDVNLTLPGLCGALHPLPTLNFNLGQASALGTLPDVSISFPYFASLQGVTLYTQCLAIDAGQPGLPVVLSNARRAAMPSSSATAGHEAVYHWASGTATAGTLFFGGSDVILLGR